jgi:hypothetical protein
MKKKNEIKLEFFNKYDNKSIKNFDNLFRYKNFYFISSIIKKDNFYEITFIDFKGFSFFFIIRFLSKRSIHKAGLEVSKKKISIV